MLSLWLVAVVDKRCCGSFLNTWQNLETPGNVVKQELIGIFQTQTHTPLKKPAHPTPPHPIWRFRKFTGRFQLLIWPWPGGGGARPWPSGAGGEESGAGSGPPRSGSGPGPGPRHFLRPKRHLAMAWRRRHQAMAK